MNCKLELRDLAKSFPSGNSRIQVLQRINILIHQGEFICLVGPSGSGKSTLLRMIAGFEEPESGAVFLDGAPLSKPDARRMMIFQDFNQLFPWKTVLQNITFPLKIKKSGGSDRNRKAIARRYLAMMMLEGYEEYYPYQLSGGMKQKVALARALALQPEVLLMDEPFGSLDAQTRGMLQRTLLKLWKDTGVTAIFVTHDIQEAIILADRILILSQNSHDLKVMITNSLERPRDPGDPRFADMWQRVYSKFDAVDGDYLDERDYSSGRT